MLVCVCDQEHGRPESVLGLRHVSCRVFGMYCLISRGNDSYIKSATLGKCRDKLGTSQ